MATAARLLSPSVDFQLDGQSVGISSFTYKAPSESLGAGLEVSIANPYAAVNALTTAQLRIGLKIDGVKSHRTLLRNAPLVSKLHRSSFALDEFTTSFEDELSNKQKISPDAPLKIYDPNRVTIAEDEYNTKDAILQENGDPIQTTFKAVPNLNLQYILNYIFKDILGFPAIITNIPNFAVREIVFSLGSSYFSSITSLINLFEPVYAQIENDTLLILDAFGTLPEGLPIKPLSGKAYIVAEKANPVKKIANSLLLTYQVPDTSGNYVGPITTRVVVEPPATAGTFGNPGWQQTLVTRILTDLHNNESNPSEVTQTEEVKSITQIYGFAGYPGINVLMSEETQDSFFTPDFSRPIGYQRTINKRLKLPGIREDMIDNVLEEKNRIEWKRADYNPDEFIKIWDITSIRGLVMLDSQPNFDVEGVDPYKTVNVLSLTDANLLKLVDSEDAGDNYVERREISSTISFWQELSNGQVNIRTSSVDHLTGVTKNERSSLQIAAQAVNANDEKLINQTRLIKNLDSIAVYGFREPLSIDAGQVPFELALPKAKQHLVRTGQAPRQATVTMPFPDLTIRKGTIRTLKLRNDNNEKFLITGITIKGENLTTLTPSITQVLEGVILESES